MLEKKCPECGHPMRLDETYNPPVWKCTNIVSCGIEIEKDNDESAFA